MKNITFYFVLIFISLACENQKIDIKSNRKVIVEAFLFENQAVTNIKLSYPQPFSEKKEGNIPISDAKVSIIWNAHNYELELMPEKAGAYYYPHNDLEIKAGEYYEILIKYDKKIITSYTTVPYKVQKFDASSDILHVLYHEGLPTSIQINWENSNNNYYIAQITAKNANGISGFYTPTAPFNGNSFVILPDNIAVYGEHLFKLYSINNEYYNLYFDNGFDSREGFLPYTNIQNGVGIFTALSCDSLLFNVED